MNITAQSAQYIPRKNKGCSATKRERTIFEINLIDLFIVMEKIDFFPQQQNLIIVEMQMFTCLPIIMMTHRLVNVNY